MVEAGGEVLGSATTPDLHGSNNNNNNDDLLNQWVEGEAKVRRVGRMQASIGPSVAESPSKDDVGREMLRVAPPVPSISGWAPVVPASTARTSPRVRKAQPGPILPGSFTRRFIAVKKKKERRLNPGTCHTNTSIRSQAREGKEGPAALPISVAACFIGRYETRGPPHRSKYWTEYGRFHGG